MGRIGKMIFGNYQFGGYSHADFGIANDHVFMNELHEALAHLRPHDHPQHAFHSSRFDDELEEEDPAKNFARFLQ